MDQIILAIEQSCVKIYETLGKTIPNTIKTEQTTNTNSSGDIQKPLDITTDLIIKDYLKRVTEVAGLISEEENNFIETSREGEYIVTYDPLDGSGNSVLNLSTGSIFEIFRAKSPSELSGDSLVAAVYSIYGPTLEMVSVKPDSRTRSVFVRQNSENSDNGGNGDNKLVKVIIDNDLKVPEKGKIYIANEGNYPRWTSKIQNYIDSLKVRSLRWMACFAADFHRLLLEGGTFLYPTDTKQTQGKLRLLYEVYPLAFIFTQCGGIALTDTGQPALEVKLDVENLHQRTSILLFGKSEYLSWCRF